MIDWESTSGAGTFPRCRRCKAVVLRGSMRDPCLGDLADPAIVSACCGHARPDLATVCFVDGQVFHGAQAINFFSEHNCGPYGSLEERRVNTA